MYYTAEYRINPSPWLISVISNQGLGKRVEKIHIQALHLFSTLVALKSCTSILACYLWIMAYANHLNLEHLAVPKSICKSLPKFLFPGFSCLKSSQGFLESRKEKFCDDTNKNETQAVNVNSQFLLGCRLMLVKMRGWSPAGGERNGSRTSRI